MPKAAAPVTYEPLCGMSIAHACREALKLCARHGAPVAFNFNGVDVTAEPGERPEAIEHRWQDETNRQAEAYRNSPECKAAEAEAAARLRTMQFQTDDLIARLPGVVNDLAALVRWCVELSKSADHIEVKWPRSEVIRAIEAAGWQANAHVGQPAADFTVPQVIGEYIVGQALSCMQDGMPPHPVSEKFAREGGFLPSGR